MTNFYENKDVQKLLTKYHNPCFDDHHVKVPFRMGIVAASGAGKTQFLLNLIAKMHDTFGFIHVVYKASEPLYEFLEKKIGDKFIKFYTKLSDLPSPNDIEHKDVQQLLVLDDQVNESDKLQQGVKEWFIRGRKCGKGVSICYLTQSYFRVPKIIRQQFSYLIILKLSSDRDLKLILGDFALGLDQSKLMQVYKDATSEKFNFLKVDLDEPNNNRKFSHNWTGFYHLDDGDSDSD